MHSDFCASKVTICRFPKGKFYNSNNPKPCSLNTILNAIIMKSPRKSMHKILILEDEDLIATGSEKAVYPYPDDNLKLVKVLLKKTPQGNRSVLLNVLARRFPSLLWRQISKEYGEYTRLMLANQNHDFIPPISHLFGFVTTQKGLACVTEKK